MGTESTRGVPLAGLAVKVTTGFYMIGLSNLDADKERNLGSSMSAAGSISPWSTATTPCCRHGKGRPASGFADGFKAWKQ